MKENQRLLIKACVVATHGFLIEAQANDILKTNAITLSDRENIALTFVTL